MGEIVFLNGRFLDSRKAKISVLTTGILFGWGLFESMRSYNGTIVYLEEHLKRIRDSAKLIAINLSFSFAKLKRIIKEMVDKNSLKDAYVRLTLSESERGTDILVIAKRYQPYSIKKYRKGFCTAVSSLRQLEDSLLARIKSTSRLLYQLSLKEAKDRGFDEAIILNSRGYIAETSRSNIFLVKGRQLFTPSLSCGCLAGITRKVIFDLAKKNNLKIYEGKFTLKDLYEADEAFLTNSLMGVMPLISVGGHLIKNALRGKVTGYFIKKYNSLLKNGA